jgi:hypothetical protein
MAAIHNVRVHVHVYVHVYVLIDGRKYIVRVTSMMLVVYAIITIIVILLQAGVCVRIDVMHALKISIIDTSGAVCGVVINIVRLEKILRGRGQRNAEDVYGYERWKSVQCTGTHADDGVLEIS